MREIERLAEQLTTIAEKIDELIHLVQMDHES